MSLLFVKITPICLFNSFNILNIYKFFIKTQVPATVTGIYSKMPLS